MIVCPLILSLRVECSQWLELLANVSLDFDRKGTAC
jgi:hypothetical protein